MLEFLDCTKLFVDIGTEVPETERSGFRDARAILLTTVVGKGTSRYFKFFLVFKCYLNTRKPENSTSSKTGFTNPFVSVSDRTIIRVFVGERKLLRLVS